VRLDEDTAVVAPTVPDADAAARGGLSRDRHERLVDLERPIERDRAAAVEDDRPRTSRLERGAEAPRSRVIEVRHGDHPSAAAADRSRTEPLRAWERHHARPCDRGSREDETARE
jgi:hypothetical protein